MNLSSAETAQRVVNIIVSLQHGKTLRRAKTYKDFARRHRNVLASLVRYVTPNMMAGPFFD